MNLLPASMDGCGELVQKLVCMKRGGNAGGSGGSDSPEPWLMEAPWYQALAPLQSPSSPQPPEYLSLMKRRSRDMETETEEELLLLVYPSSAMDHHGVEEYISDVPFAGLFKGSTSIEIRAERPKTLRKLRNVYEHANMMVSCPTSSGGDDTGYEEAKCMSDASSKSAGGVLSPFDEQEEWAKISEIMASFGTGLVRESVFVSELEKEFQARLGLLNLGDGNTSNVDPLASPIGKWLASINLPQYEQTFINFGYDNLEFLNGVLNEADLKEMCVSNEEDRTKILESIKDIPNKIKDVRVSPVNNNNNNSNNNNNNNNDTKEGGDEPASVDEWLEMLDLSCYADTFRKHLYTEMERVRNIWEVELTAVLEITKPGHRHRMMASLPDNGSQPTIQDINQELSHLKNSMQELETKVIPQPSGTGTLRHSHKKNRPAPPPPPPPGGPAAPDLEIRDPSSLLVGVPPTLTATWRHRPHALLSGHLTYHARYLGSTVVLEMQGNESTKKSIQRLKKPQSEQNSPRDIYLAISYRGVKFLSGDTRELVCEHEIRNIHCACQDADDLTFFAYITKDHASKSHYCHVFSVQNLDQATEIILTLGQAFEVAYQMALRESSGKGNGHTRSHSANLTPITTQPNHNRSHSVNEIKLNGHTTAASPTLVAEDV